jgi:hypothetical protein
MRNYIRIKNILPRLSERIVHGSFKTLYISEFDFSIVKIKLTRPVWADFGRRTS